MTTTPDYRLTTADAAEVARRVLRADTVPPGFALIDLGPDVEPRTFRARFLALAEGLAAHYRQRWDRPLLPFWLGRFDQKQSTKAHRDGGPDEAILLLGYEPTPLASRVFLLDFSRYALDHGLTPRDFLDRYQPTFQDDRELTACTTEAAPFCNDHYQILAINNSQTAPGEGTLGVLHKAVMTSPVRPEVPRWVCSLMLGPPGAGEVSPAAVAAFLEEGRAAGG